MEDSLRRSSELGREVLERARRRDVDWWSLTGGQGMRIRPGVETPEEEGPRSLEEAFSALSHLMRQTTEQCERYHRCIPASAMDRSEVQHVSRFHCRKLQRLKPPGAMAAAPLQSSGRPQDSRDVYIEVAPGTYSISARSPNYQPQTHLVNIPPGQSVDLTFSL